MSDGKFGRSVVGCGCGGEGLEMEGGDRVSIYLYNRWLNGRFLCIHDEMLKDTTNGGREMRLCGWLWLWEQDCIEGKGEGGYLVVGMEKGRRGEDRENLEEDHLPTLHKAPNRICLTGR